MSSVIIYCRSGFENDAAAEITFQAAEQGFAGYVKTKQKQTAWNYGSK